MFATSGTNNLPPADFMVQQLVAVFFLSFSLCCFSVFNAPSHVLNIFNLLYKVTKNPLVLAKTFLSFSLLHTNADVNFRQS